MPNASNYSKVTPNASGYSKTNPSASGYSAKNLSTDFLLSQTGSYILNQTGGKIKLLKGETTAKNYSRPI